MKAQLEMNFYGPDGVMYNALDDSNQRILHNFPDDMILPATATIYDEVPVAPTKLVKKPPATLSEITSRTAEQNL